jgi:acetolactate decarboxylase
MNHLWQSMPSSAFKAGLYRGYLTVAEAREHGNFGVGEYEFLDGEVTAIDGKYYRQTAEGKLLPLADEERLCFASVAPFAPTDDLALDGGLTDATIQPLFLKAFNTPNGVFAMRIDGSFTQVTATAIARQNEPFLTFDKVTHVPFHFQNVTGTMVCFYEPGYLGQTGIAGFHFHFLAADRTGGGHVTGFTLAEGSALWCRLGGFALRIPGGSRFDKATIN